MGKESMGSDAVIVNSHEFELYKSAINRIYTVETQHHNVPTSYPCVVKTFAMGDIEEQAGDKVLATMTYLHLFFYPSDAEKLVMAAEIAEELFIEELRERFLAKDEPDCEEECEVHEKIIN